MTHSTYFVTHQSRPFVRSSHSLPIISCVLLLPTDLLWPITTLISTIHSTVTSLTLHLQSTYCKSTLWWRHHTNQSSCLSCLNFPPLVIVWPITLHRSTNHSQFLQTSPDHAHGTFTMLLKISRCFPKNGCEKRGLHVCSTTPNLFIIDL